MVRGRQVISLGGMAGCSREWRASVLAMIEQEKQEKQATAGHGGMGPALSARELEVLRLACAGLTYAEIAEQLTISWHTVNTHCKRVCRKLRVSGMRQAGARTWRLGLIREEEGGGVRRT